MKVLLVSYLLDPRLGGGAATAAAHVVRGLAGQGVEVVTVTTHNDPRPTVTNDNKLRGYIFRPRNLYWVADKSRQPIIKKIVWQLLDVWNPHVYRTVREIVRREKPDVVHIHKLRGLSPAVWSAVAAESRPLVQTCHDYEAISPEGTLESTVGRLARQRHWMLRPYQAVRARLSNTVDVVTAPSHYTLDVITGAGFFGRARRLVVPNSHGLNEAELEAIRQPPRLVAWPDSPLRLLYLGRLETNKGIDILCQAVAQLVADLPHLQLNVAGSGSREADLRAEYAALPQICFHGHVSGSAKQELLAQTDVVVMPSVWQEVFGISIIEAFAHGKPVIASRVGGIPEIVRDKVTGLLVTPGDSGELSVAIQNLAAQPERLQTMSPACRLAARAYTPHAVVAGYLAAYDSIHSPSGE